MDAGRVLDRIRSKMSASCSVRRSPFCNDIIAMRLGGTPFSRISQWLSTKGKEFEISPSTLESNIKPAMVKARVLEKDFMMLAVEAQERLGTVFSTDIMLEFDGMVYTQKYRIDYLLRKEKGRQQTDPSTTYSDRRIGKEIKLLADILYRMARVQYLMRDVRSLDNEDTGGEEETLELEEETLSFLESAILSGKVSVLKVNKK